MNLDLSELKQSIKSSPAAVIALLTAGFLFGLILISAGPDQWNIHIHQTQTWRWGALIFGISLALGCILVCIGKLISSWAGKAQKTGEEQVSPKDFLRSLQATFFTLPFVAIVLWFHLVDPWQNFFSRSGYVYPLYYALRFGFIAYIAWLFFSVGHGVVQRLKIDAGLGGLDCIILSFFTGFSVICIAFYFLGIFSAYYKFLTLSIIAFLVYFSYPLARKSANDAACGIVKILGQRSTFQLLYESTLISMLCLVCLLAAAHQGLSVSGHSYDATHYVPYFLEVLARHSIEPNQYWWHYYISKGAGATVLSVMLTDLHGIQLISWMCMLFTTLVVWSLVNSIAPRSPWPYLASIVFSINTAVHFPYFIKLHIVLSAFLTMTIWLYAKHSILDSSLKRQFTYIWALIVAATLLQIPVSAAFLLPCLVFFAITYWLKNNHQAFNQIVLVFSVGTGVLTLLLLQNYVRTGVMEITPFKVFFEIGDQRKFADWVSPFLIVNLYEGSQPSTGRLNWENLAQFSPTYLSDLFSFPLLFPLFPRNAVQQGVFLALTALLFIFIRQKKRFVQISIAAVVLLGWASIVSIIVSQPGSMQRFFSGFYPLLVVLIVATWAMLFRTVKASTLPKFLHSRIDTRTRMVGAAVIVKIAVLGFSLYSVASNMNPYFAYKNGFPQLNEMYSQLRGHSSFRSSLLTLNELTDQCVKAQAAAGNDEKILLVTFVVQMACHYMPGSGMLWGGLGPHLREWHTATFGTANDAKAVYQRYGISHFYFDTSVGTFILGCEAYSPLFTTGPIRQYLKVVWRDENSYLLGWRETNEPESAEDKAFFHSWETNKSFDMYPMCKRVEYYYRTQEGKFPLHIDITLPPVKGWQ